MITVSDKCTKCGRCAAVCPSMVIDMVEGVPTVKVEKEKGCIVCGHCVAVCPEGALDHQLARLAHQTPVDFRATAHESQQLLRGVRSIRCYKKQQVTPELIAEAMDVARYVPTARNTQGISFLAVMDADKVKQLSEMVIAWIEREMAAGAAWVAPYAGVARGQRASGLDMIFRGAPHVVIALAPKNNLFGVDNARLGMVYGRTQAAALGLGSCWAGFFEIYARHNAQELGTYLAIPNHLQVGAAIMIGYPKYEYHRLVEREALQIDFV